MHKTLVGSALVILTAAFGVCEVTAQEAALTYKLAAARSNIHVVTRRTGFFSFLGHDHAILAREWSGTVCYSPAPLNGHATVDVVTGSLVIDTDSARKIAGLGKGPSPSQVRELQTKVLDAQHLDVAHHPAISLDVRSVTEAPANKLDARGTLVIRGVSREVVFPVSLSMANDTVRFRGVLKVPQSGFGIRPESVAGVVRVADVVEIHFDLLGIATGAACSR